MQEGAPHTISPLLGYARSRRGNDRPSIPLRQSSSPRYSLLVLTPCPCCPGIQEMGETGPGWCIGAGRQSWASLPSEEQLLSVCSLRNFSQAAVWRGAGRVVGAGVACSQPAQQARGDKSLAEQCLISQSQPKE